ncbi:MAG: fumarate reductase/succinate dehydrogenase flavoprotein subunit [Desulfobulbaceae bacterium]|nr:fumarate reductase/succinate dehydrogenase flavoprotein subunit [Desulfobulbaceae bacterium]
MHLDAKIPAGPLADKWSRYLRDCRLVSPSNRRHCRVIVVGGGLAGAAAAATLAEQGYQVKCFYLQDSPRRSHSIAAQGGINAAKNYQNDGDSVFRLFADTLKGGDFRSREANVYRLAELSGNIIDQAVAQGVPFAREYGGQLANRSFGGALVSRTFYARGQTGQQLLLGAYGALMRQVQAGRITLFPRREMLELVRIDGQARGIITRNLLSGALERHGAQAVVLATGGYGNTYFLSTNAMSANVSAIWRAHRQGAGFANPCFVQIHPTCIPVSGEHQAKLTLMSESLRNDGRVWVPLAPGDQRPPSEIPEAERDYYLEKQFPAYGNLVPRDVASRSTKSRCDAGQGVGTTGRAVYLDLSAATRREGEGSIRRKYGNLFEMYQRITGHDPLHEPMQIYPAVHYAMGGLWVDYQLMTTIPGLFALGEANFSDHGANRLGASALMQGLADGYFILPATLGNYLAGICDAGVTTDHPEFARAVAAASTRTTRLLEIRGRRTAPDFHRHLGQLLWEHCGLSRHRNGLETALRRLPELRAEFWDNLLVPGSGSELNQTLEQAGRVADYLEFAELLLADALAREESCGCHLREESQTEAHEPRRDDANFAHVAVWEHRQEGTPRRHQEQLTFENLPPGKRDYR